MKQKNQNHSIEKNLGKIGFEEKKTFVRFVHAAKQTRRSHNLCLNFCIFAYTIRIMRHAKAGSRRDYNLYGQIVLF